MWTPGRPVVTPSDIAELQEWRKTRILDAQKDRRSKLRRIDYYPTDKAAAVIDGNTFGSAGGDYSSVINGIVEEWAASNSGIK